MTNNSSNSKNNQAGKNLKLITRMINSSLAFLSCVFILKGPGEYRLVIFNNNKNLHDSRYKTLQGARLACNNLTRKKMYKSGIKPTWSFFYPVDEKWLRAKLHKKPVNK